MGYNHKTKYTDWCPIPNDCRLGICLHMWKPVKEVSFFILNNGGMYITQSVITRFFSVDPDDRVIMESQCIKKMSEITHHPKNVQQTISAVFAQAHVYLCLQSFQIGSLCPLFVTT